MIAYYRGGTGFMPGLGISTSGHATRLVLFCNRLQRNIEAFKESAARNEIARPFATQIASLIGVPVRLGVSFEPTGTMLVYDTRSLKADRAWFPRLCFVHRRRPKPEHLPDVEIAKGETVSCLVAMVGALLT